MPSCCSAPRTSTGASSAQLARLGLTAGASAPEVLIEEIIDAFAERYEVSVETVSAVEESGIFFPLPRQVRGGEAAE